MSKLLSFHFHSFHFFSETGAQKSLRQSAIFAVIALCNVPVLLKTVKDAEFLRSVHYTLIETSGEMAKPHDLYEKTVKCLNEYL